MFSELVLHDSDALLFDWDGTLVDSQSANYRAMSYALAQVGLNIEEDWFNARTGLSAAEMIQVLIGSQDPCKSINVDSVVACRDARFLKGVEGIQVNSAIAQIVEDSFGKRRMAIASGGSRRIILATLCHLPFRECFDSIVTRDDVERGKPAPDIFLCAAGNLNVEPARCTVFEDSDEGIAAAEAAGMRVVDVRGFAGRTSSF